MSKTATAGTLSPRRLGVGGAVTDEDFTRLVELQNYVVCHSHHNHISMVVGVDDWYLFGLGNQVGPHNIILGGSSGWQSEFIGRIYVSEDTQEIVIGAIMVIPTSNEAQIRYTIGSATAVVLDFTSASLQDSAVLSTGDTGTGVLSYEIEVNHTVGSSNGLSVEEIWIRSNIISAANLPDPVLE